MTLPLAKPKKSGSGAASRQTALLVLGMHRSGTSALTRMLNLLGSALPRTLMPAAESNAPGHWESVAIADLNDGILAAAGSAWDDWLPFNPRFAETADAARWHETARACLREEFGDAPLFVLKDPRICRLVPFWRAVLAEEGITPVVLMPLRNPVEVAQSLAARNGMEEVEGLLLWLRHVLDAEAATRDLPRVFLTYDQVLGDWSGQAERIATKLDIVWPRLSGLTGIEIETFLTPDLRHHEASSQDMSRVKIAAPWVAQAYAILSNWAQAGERADDLPVLDRLRAAFDDAGPILLRPFLAARKSATDMREAQAQRDIAVQDRDSLAQTNDVLTSEQARTREELADLAAQLAALQSMRTDLIAEGDHAAEERQALQQRIDAITAERETLIGTREAMIGEQSQVREEQAGLAARVAMLEGERNALLAQRDDAAAAQSQMDERLRAPAAERDALLAERETLVMQMQAEQELAGQHWAEAQQLGQERTALSADNARLAAELTREQLLAAGSWEERCRIAAEIGVLQQALDRAERDRADLRERLATDQIEHRHVLGLAENRLRQRDEHIAQTEALRDQALQERDALIETHRADIAEASARLEAMATTLDALQQTAEAQATHVAQVSTQLDVRTTELGAVQEAFANLERMTAADVRQRDTALVQERWRRDAIDSQRQTALAELEAVRQQLAEAQSRPDFEPQLATTIAERDNERIEFAKTLATRTADIAALNRDLAARVEECGALRVELDRSRAEVAINERARRDAWAELEAERDNERIEFAETLATRTTDIAALNRDLAARGEECGTLSVELDRSRAEVAINERARQIADVLVSAPWWWVLVPTGVRVRWLEERLMNRDLFDAQAYRERYHDVAQSGIPPALHFLRHGLAEGREG